MDDPEVICAQSPGVFPDGFRFEVDRIVWVGGQRFVGLEDRYIVTLVQQGRAIWQAAIAESHGSPFVKAVFWLSAGLVAFCGSASVVALNATTGHPVWTLHVPGGYVSDALPLDDDALYVLGSMTVMKVDRLGRVVWNSAVLAVDGIVLVSFDERELVLGCELDPPGGWERVVLDRRTGRDRSSA